MVKFRARTVVATALVAGGLLLAQPADAQPQSPSTATEVNAPAQSDTLSKLPLVGGLLSSLGGLAV